MTLEKLSDKQKKVLKWAHNKTLSDKYNAIICDGAVRSGKTIVMTVGFIHWAMRYFDGAMFAICGRTLGSIERNIVKPMMNLYDITDYYSIEYSSAKGIVTIKNGERINEFYLFGGKDETSYMSIQGMTLSGVFLDEVALLPQSFVEQAIARTLSVKSAKLWFNCNPDSPSHWFYRDWILDADGENKKKSYHLHFLMTDNPILDDESIEKATALYDGAFLRRYIYGEWVTADGLVYPSFDEDIHTGSFDNVEMGKCFVSIDYGTHNPCSMGLWNVVGGKAYRIDEFYYDSRIKNRQLTDEEYYQKLIELIGDKNVLSVVIDPSASSFIELIRRRGELNVISAKNDVTNGIRTVASMIKSGKILIDKKCKDCIREFSMYQWNVESEKDEVLKTNDHAMDELRYFCYTILKKQQGFITEQISCVKSYLPSFID